MTPADAARLLALAAAFDRRTIGEMDAVAWADALDGLTPDECAQAIRDHYRNRRDWLMPADVRERVTIKRRDDAERRHADRLHAEHVAGQVALEQRNAAKISDGKSEA